MINKNRVRRFIIAIFSIEVIAAGLGYLADLFEIGLSFIPIVAMIHSRYVIRLNILGDKEIISPIWLFLIVLLSITIVSDIRPQSNTLERVYIVFILISGIFAYRFILFPYEIIIYAIGIAAISIGIWKFAFRRSTSESVYNGTIQTTFALIYGLTWGLVNEWVFVIEIILGVLGIIIFMKWLLGKISSPPRYVGIEDSLYRSTIDLLSNSTGVAAACIIYLALFSMTFLVTDYKTGAMFRRLNSRG